MKNSRVSESSKNDRVSHEKLESRIFYLKVEFPPSAFTVKPNGFLLLSASRTWFLLQMVMVFCYFWEARPARPGSRKYHIGPEGTGNKNWDRARSVFYTDSLESGIWQKSQPVFLYRFPPVFISDSLFLAEMVKSGSQFFYTGSMPVFWDSLLYTPWTWPTVLESLRNP